MTDHFADVRDKRISELTPEQRDRAYEMWAREHMEWLPEQTFELYQSLLRVIDRLRGEKS